MTPTVLLLHGFTHTGSSWEPVVAALGKRYRAITPDIRGHGAASGVRPVTLEAVQEDLASLSESDELALVGYSMGGRIALHCALAWPDRLRRLVLIGASPGIADPAERAQRRAQDEALAAQIEDSRIEEFATRWAETPVLTGLPQATLVRVHADRLRSAPAGLACALRGLGTGALAPVWERLGELAMPVTLVVGERDLKFLRIAEQMRELIPAAEILVVPGAGHAAHLEAPDQVAAAISGG